MLLTSRPQTQPLFSAWNPEWILPEADQNLADMRLVLSKRLQESGAVQQRDIGSATELLVHKSQVGPTWFRVLAVGCWCLTQPSTQGAPN